MKLLIEPHYRKDSVCVDLKLPFEELCNYNEYYNNKFCFNAGFDLYLINTEEDDFDNKVIVATVEGQFFKYNSINAFDINILDLADNISRDTYQSIVTLVENNLIIEDIMYDMPLICYLSRLYIYPQYRNKGIASYILKNLQEIFEYITSELTSIFITLPCPQIQRDSGYWDNTDDENMLNRMIKILEQYEFKTVGVYGCYYKSYIK